MSQTKSSKKIVLGSMDFYITEWTGTVPTDEEIETDDNKGGYTKNGATLKYEATWYVATSDDGKVRKRRLVGDSASIEYGNITWRGEIIKKYISTARIEEKDGKRTTRIGGIMNDDGKRYLIRGVHHDPIDGDIRITGVGVNTGGWEAVFKPDSESVINPTFELEPLDNSGSLLLLKESIDETSAPEGE